jgi:Tol biopolymer transport system component
MYDVATRTSRRIGEGCQTPIAFSPDGARLFCRSGNSLFIMTVATGSIQAVTVPQGGFSSAFWGTRGLKVLVADLNDRSLSAVDVETNASTLLIKPGQLRLSEGSYYSNIAWSRDGGKVAVSTWRDSGRSLGSSTELVIYVIDTETAVTQRVAVQKLATITVIPDIKQMAFSPDGRSIAYVVGTHSDAQVYLAPVL